MPRRWLRSTAKIVLLSVSTRFSIFTTEDRISTEDRPYLYVLDVFLCIWCACHFFAEKLANSLIRYLLPITIAGASGPIGPPGRRVPHLYPSSRSSSKCHTVLVWRPLPYAPAPVCFCYRSSRSRGVAHRLRRSSHGGTHRLSRARRLFCGVASRREL